MRASPFLLYLLLLCIAPDVGAQSLRFSNHRELDVPDYATMRYGPAYLAIEFSQQAGYQYTESEGAGTDYLFGSRRGKTREDGSDYPLISSLVLRNYLILGRHMDLDASLQMTYSQYPNETQEDEFIFHLVEEGVLASISMEIELTPFVKGMLYESPSFLTDYVDTRGIEDEQGGRGYERFENEFGLDLDWLVAKEANLGLSLGRTDVMPSDAEFDSREQATHELSVIYEQQVSKFLILGGNLNYESYLHEAATWGDSEKLSYNAIARVRLTDRTRASLSIGSSAGTVSSFELLTDDDSLVSTAEYETESEILSVWLETQLADSLSHNVEIVRDLVDGYNSAFETSDAFTYNLEWNGEFVSLSFSSALMDVEPVSESVNAYSHWSGDLNGSWQATSFVNISFSTSYTIRDNEGIEIAGDEEVDEELSFDYDTWTSRLGMSFPIAKDLAFSTYVQRTERESDSANLQFTRLSTGTFLTYHHVF